MNQYDSYTLPTNYTLFTKKQCTRWQHRSIGESNQQTQPQIQPTYPGELRSQETPEKAYRGRCDNFHRVPLQDRGWTHRWICGSYDKTSLWSTLRNSDHPPVAVPARSCWSNSRGMTWVVHAAVAIRDQQIDHHYCSAWIFIFLKRKL